MPIKFNQRRNRLKTLPPQNRRPNEFNYLSHQYIFITVIREKNKGSLHRYKLWPKSYICAQDELSSYITVNVKIWIVIVGNKIALHISFSCVALQRGLKIPIVMYALTSCGHTTQKLQGCFTSQFLRYGCIYAYAFLMQFSPFFYISIVDMCVPMHLATFQMRSID